MFRMIPLILFIYVWLRLVLPLPLSVYTKAVLAALLCAASLKQQFFAAVGGNFFSPELPRWLIELYGVAFGALFLLFIFTLLKDLLLFYSSKEQKLVTIFSLSAAYFPHGGDGYDIRRRRCFGLGLRHIRGAEAAADT